MEIFIGNQLKNIGYSIILGLIFGAFYDIITIIHIIVGVVSDSGDKAVRKDFPARLVFLFTDLCFMLGIAVSMSLFLYEYANGDFRMYLLAGAAAGFWFYRMTLGRLVSAVSEAAVRLIRKVFRILVIRPIGWILRMFAAVFRWLWRRTAGVWIRMIRERMGEARIRREEKRLIRQIRMETGGVI